MMVRAGKIAGNECILQKYQRPSRIFIFETVFYWGKPISGQDTLTITRLVRTPTGARGEKKTEGENTKQSPDW